MKRFAVIAIAVATLTGCDYRLTKGEETAIKTGTGAAGQVFGIPYPVGEKIAEIALIIAAAIGGHKHGCRHERKKSKAKETTHA